MARKDGGQTVGEVEEGEEDVKDIFGGKEGRLGSKGGGKEGKRVGRGGSGVN